MPSTNFTQQRERLVESELRLLGIRDDAVLHAMWTVPREEFVSEAIREFAYRNAPLPISSGQTISQPLIVAYMAESLELAPHERVARDRDRLRLRGGGPIAHCAGRVHGGATSRIGRHRKRETEAAGI
jgi:hypothetical protein